MSNERALKFLKEAEGCRLFPYYDLAGVLTVGYGSTGPHVKLGKPITQAEADALLRKDIERFAGAVDRLVKVPLNDNQRAAAISFAFNVGVGALEKSTLLRKLNAGDYDAVPDELARWNKATVGGKKVAVKGLTNRRAAEAALWNTPAATTRRVPRWPSEAAKLPPLTPSPEAPHATENVTIARTPTSGNLTLPPDLPDDYTAEPHAPMPAPEPARMGLFERLFSWLFSTKGI